MLLWPFLKDVERFWSFYGAWGSQSKIVKIRRLLQSPSFSSSVSHNNGRVIMQIDRTSTFFPPSKRICWRFSFLVLIPPTRPWWRNISHVPTESYQPFKHHLPRFCIKSEWWCSIVWKIQEDQFIIWQGNHEINQNVLIRSFIFSGYFALRS